MSAAKQPHLTPTSAAPTLTPAPEPIGLHPMLRLQRAAGNHAVGQILQAKLEIGSPNDPAEREADEMAAKVMGGVAGVAGNNPQRSASCSASTPTAPPIVDSVLAASGRPLGAPEQSFMEQRFGHNFDNVRIHTDAQAAASAQAVGAKAYTVGRDVVFAEGSYAPAVAEGQRLLAHELTHVVQAQGTSAASPRLQREPGGGAAPPAPAAPAGQGMSILVVGAENEAEFAYARDALARGNTVTVVNPIETAAAKAFRAAGGNFVNGPLESLPREQKFDQIREDFPYPIVPLPQVDAFAGARVDRLKPGGRWTVASEHDEFAQAFSASLMLRGVSYRLNNVPAAHEGSPQSSYVQDQPGRPASTNRYIFVVENTPGGPTTPSIPGGGRPPTVAPPQGGGQGASTGAKAVAGGMGLIVLANEILGPIGQILNQQRRNIAMGEARLGFWTRFGAHPTRGVWDGDHHRALPPETAATTAVFIGTASFPYVVDIDVNSFRAALPLLIRTYNDFLLFLDLATTLFALDENPTMPKFPTAEERRQARTYHAYVNAPDQSARHAYDVTDLIEAVRKNALDHLDETTRTELAALPETERDHIFRLRAGPETAIFRSANGDQKILSAQQILGPDPWVRPVGKRVEGGVWSWFTRGHYADRLLVAPANADAARAAQLSVYPVYQPIEDTLKEVEKGGRPILDKQQSEAGLASFVAGPGPGEDARFGTTRYYRHPELPGKWTAAIGELHQFWVNADDLEPVTREKVDKYLRGPQAAPAPPK